MRGLNPPLLQHTLMENIKMNFAFTGPRHMTEAQIELVKAELRQLIKTPADWHVGCARGLDGLVRSFAYSHHKDIEVYKIAGNERWRFAERSKKMVDAIATTENSCLYAYPNKECPTGCRPSKNPNGYGSGTWLTIAYASYRNVEIKIFPLTEIKLPAWLEEPMSTQLSIL